MGNKPSKRIQNNPPTQVVTTAVKYPPPRTAYQQATPINPYQPNATKKYYVYLVRHGTSCTNVTKKRSWMPSFLGKAGNYGPKYRYEDPELTAWGRKKAFHLGAALRNAIETDLEEKGQPRDYIVGSSALLRAQQTAYLMFFPKILWIIPYLSELYTSSLDVENQPADPKTQLSRLKQFGCWDEEDNFINPKKSDLRIDDEYYKPELAEKGNVGNTSKFMEWLGEMYGDLCESNKKPTGTPLSL